ncbi:c-type cytochrome [Cupriavidus sp. 30B13]|uniref:c-type cytochrome n=1 Tax=Cupriavidus sp. 30B13 TaxID=3384241 RepID=UPI003B8F7C4F
MKKSASMAFMVLALALPAAARAAGDAQAGKNVFASKCASCHSVGPSARGAFGPQLNGIFGRHAGSTSDYQYSDAMKKSGIVWSEKTLAAFVASPGKVVPGTRMRFWGLGNERQIADLLAYLHSYQ